MKKLFHHDGDYKGFQLAVELQTHSREFFAMWRRKPNGKWRTSCLIDRSHLDAIQCAMDCVDYILGEGKYANWPLAPADEQTLDDYPMRIPPYRAKQPA